MKFRLFILSFRKKVCIYTKKRRVYMYARTHAHKCTAIGTSLVLMNLLYA